MPLKRLEDIQKGETAEFIQVYINNEPEIFCKKFKLGEKFVLEESYLFLSEILKNLKISYLPISPDSEIPKNLEGENYSYAGMGRFAKDNRGIIKIWRIPGYAYNKKHFSKYQEKFKNSRFEQNFITREVKN